MANNMICPGCGKAGFTAKFLLAESYTIKCSECGAWSEPIRWELTKTGAQYRAEAATLRAEIAKLNAAISDAEAKVINPASLLGLGKKKTMTPAAIEQRSNAAKSRWERVKKEKKQER